MKADNCRYVSVQYTLSLEGGEVAESSTEGDPIGFIFGASQVLPGLEEGLRGLEPGESARIRLEPEEAFGEYKETFIKELPRTSFPDGQDLTPGTILVAESPMGAVPFSIRSVSGETVQADFNHPLAGRTLFFDVIIEEVRELTPLEMLKEGGTCRLGRYTS